MIVNIRLTLGNDTVQKCFLSKEHGEVQHASNEKFFVFHVYWRKVIWRGTTVDSRLAANVLSKNRRKVQPVEQERKITVKWYYRYQDGTKIKFDKEHPPFKPSEWKLIEMLQCSFVAIFNRRGK